MAQLWAVTSLFNHVRSATRLKNYEKFEASLRRQDVNLLTVEYLCEDEPSVLRICDRPGRVITVKGNSQLWQKERLVNLAVVQLPSDCEYVAWLDADIIFENDDWPRQTIEKLEQVPVLQPFSEVELIDQLGSRDGKVVGFAKQTALAPHCLQQCFESHGHTGFAWAARRQFLASVGLYDRAIVGGADHLIAHALSGSFDASCVTRLLGTHSPLHLDFLEWASSIPPEFQGPLPFVEGKIAHLWHGPLEAREYVVRNRRLAALGFDPNVELRRNAFDCWDWRDPRTACATSTASYMARRSFQ